MVTSASHWPSTLFLQSVDPDLKRSFHGRFTKTRESYDMLKEREVTTVVAESSGWKRLGKPSFRRDVHTGIVFRRAPPSRLHPAGRITICVPHELSFDVAVSHDLLHCIGIEISGLNQLQTIEHLRAHTLLSRGERPDSVDSAIAAKYTGVHREHLRYVRKHCFLCNPSAESMFSIAVECTQLLRNLTTTPDALHLKSNSPKMLEGADFSQEQNLVAKRETNNAVFSSVARYSTVLWIGLEDNMSECLSTQIIQHRYVTAANSAHVPSCFLPYRAAELLRVSGPAFMDVDREHVTAHQSIVTASILEDDTRCQVNYQTASSLQRQLTHDPSTLDPNTMIMPAWRRYDSNHRVIQKIYSLVEAYEAGVLRVFPSASEYEHAHGKTGDIWALDLIAQSAPSDWSFRPTTCDCTSACRLGKAGVLKRTHSCGSEHVIVRPTSSDISRHLGCFVNQRRASKRRAAQSTGQWFHQEFVQGLQQIGEFRVFIVTVSDATVTRGRRGEVIEVVHTFELEDRELVVTVLTSSSIWSGRPDTYGKVDLEELKGFALYVFGALRNRPDWSTNFESLEIGARIDVGITLVNESCRFFVNEVTRIYEADFFAEWLAQPGTHICREVSKALEEVFLCPAR